MSLVKAILSVSAVILLSASPAFAQGAEEAMDLASLAGGLGIAIVVFGGVFAQGKIAVAALESIGRNPGAAGQMFTPMIIGLVFCESLVLFGFAVTAKLAGVY